VPGAEIFPQDCADGLTRSFLNVNVGEHFDFYPELLITRKTAILSFTHIMERRITWVFTVTRSVTITSKWFPWGSRKKLRGQYDRISGLHQNRTVPAFYYTAGGM